MEIKAEDLKINTFSDSSSWMLMSITHIPTGTVVEGRGRLKHRLKDALVGELKGIIGLYNTQGK